jgi:hypothetical protein
VALHSVKDRYTAPLALCRFWKKVQQRLDEQGARLTTADRRRIEKAIAAKVPRPTKRQRDYVARSYSISYDEAVSTGRALLGG